MKLNWLNNSGFITKKLYAPFAVEKDSEYLQDLSSRYDILFKRCVRPLWILGLFL